jgi:hypothetical protein
MNQDKKISVLKHLLFKFSRGNLFRERKIWDDYVDPILSHDGHNELLDQLLERVDFPEDIKEEDKDTIEIAIMAILSAAFLIGYNFAKEEKNEASN